MNVLKKTNDNYDRFITKRSHRQDASDYFQMKAELEDFNDNDDKMMVDAYDEASNNEIAYNALLQSEILDIGDAVNLNHKEATNENMPTSLTCLQKFSNSRKTEKKKYSCFEVNTDTCFAQ